MSQLVQMLMRAGFMTAQQAQEARAHQVVYGDRIGTNIIDLGLVDELTIAQALGALHGVPYAAGPTADTSMTLARTLRKDVAARINSVPAKWDGTFMHVFMTDPRNPRQVQELEAALRRNVRPVVVCEARMWELLGKYYNVRRGMRALSLDGDAMARAKLLMKQAIAPQPAPPPKEISLASYTSSVPAPAAAPVAVAPVMARAAVPPPAPAVPAGPELTDEDDFYSIYQQGGGGGLSAVERAVAQGEAAAARKAGGTNPSMPAVPPPQAPPPAPDVDDVPVLATGILLPLEPVEREAPQPPPVAAPVARAPVTTPPAPVVAVAPPAPAPQPSGMAASWGPMPTTPPPDDAVEVLIDEVSNPGIKIPAEAITPPAPAPAAPAEWQTASWTEMVAQGDHPEPEPPHVEEAPPVEEEPVAPTVQRDESPLTFQQAKELLAGVEDRNAIGLTVLRYALTRFKRAMLFTVQRELALGWDALGEGLSLDVAHRVLLPLAQPSVFRLAVESKAHFLGPLPKQQVNILFLKLIGGKVPRSVFLMPVVVRGKVVNLIYGDNGPGKEVETDIGELLILAQHINRSYEALIKKAA
ncbi:MAG: hypothetical protein AB2A00_37450 [Myxococcota bacterium]